MHVLELPFELVSNIISFLDPKSARIFVQTNKPLYDISKDDSFWATLCRIQGICYCHPESTWRELFSFGKFFNMCTHINPRDLYASLPEKRELLWTNVNDYLKERDTFGQSHSMCLHRNCDHYDLTENYDSHYSVTGHSILMKVSSFNVLEMWCHSCKKAIGFDNFSPNADYNTKTERHIMKEVTEGLVSMNTEDHLNTKIVSNRRKIELGIYKIQMRQFNCHIVEKDWYDKWLDFITEKADAAPGPLANQNLLQQDGSLNPTLVLGKDFELVGNLTRWYIERIYGTSDSIFSINNLESSANYCKLVHSIKIRHQMVQVARYSFN